RIQIVNARNVPRLLRAQYFCQAARSEADLGVKISLYMTCLEILFSNDASELAHKLSERIACFLATDPKQRKAIFGTIKRAYNIRSKVVHGDVVTAKHLEESDTMSQQVD